MPPKKKGVAKRPRKILRDNIHGVTNPAIKRLALQGGAPKLAGTSYDEIRIVIKKELEHVLSSTLAFTDADGRKTVSSKDVVNGIAACSGNRLAFSKDAKYKSCKKVTVKKGGVKKGTKRTVFYEAESE